MRQRGLSMAVAVGTIGVLAYCGRQYFGELSRLKDASPAALIAVLLLFLAARFAQSEVIRLGLTRLGSTVTRYESFMLNIVMGYTNLVIPRAGLTAPAMYFNMKHGVAYSHYMSLVLVNLMLQLLASGLSGFLCLAWFWMTPGSTIPWGLVGLFTAVSAGATVAVCLRFSVPESWTGRTAGFLRRLNSSWSLQRVDRTVVLHTLALQLLILLLRAARLHVAFLAIDEPVHFLGAFVSSVLADFTLLVSITPSAMGLREAAITYGSELLGTTPAIALSAAILDRLVWTAAIIVIAQIGMWQFVFPSYGQRASP